jgi:osmotically-inducible protein OsmY
MKLKYALLIGALSISSYSTYANRPENNTIEKDNSALNKGESITAETQAKGTDENVEVTRKLRERIMSDEHLSSSAKNIKIITVSEAIILSGPVLNKKEKRRIEKMARAIDRTKTVQNKLTY